MINKILIGISILCLSLGFIGCNSNSPSVKESKIENNKNITDTTNTEDKIRDEKIKKLQDELKQLQADLEKLENQLVNQETANDTASKENTSSTRYNDLYNIAYTDNNTTTIYTNTANINAIEAGSAFFTFDGENVGKLTVDAKGNVIQLVTSYGDSPTSLRDLKYTAHGYLSDFTSDPLGYVLFTIEEGIQWSERTVG